MRARVLLIEDDKVDQVMVRRLLEGWCELVQAETFDEALVLAVQHWTLVICDRALPGCDDVPAQIGRLLPEGVLMVVLSGAPDDALQSYRDQGVLALSKERLRQMAKDVSLAQLLPALTRMTDALAGDDNEREVGNGN